MDRANYTENGSSRYPLSTEGLDFIQRQIELIYNVAQLYGPNYILKPSTAMVEGVIVVNGEMMPLEGSPLDYIQVTEEYDKLEADGMVFEKARVRRLAHYVASSTGEGCYAASQFPTITTIEAMRPHLTPKGAIVMWSGAIEAIPAGWALCDGNNNTPDLSGRFIVGVGKSSDGETDYQLNKTGGKEKILLKAAESGLPEHTHTVTGPFGETGEKGIRGANYWLGYPKSFTTSEAKRDAAKPHENRPPYYVLAYIMKVK